MGERRFSTKNRFVSFLLAIAMVLTLLPIGAVQAKAEGSRQIIMHFKNSTNWEAVYTKIAEGDSWTAVDGYGYANSWPGAEVEKILQMKAGIALQLAQIQRRNSIVYLIIKEMENKQVILDLRQMVLK